MKRFRIVLLAAVSMLIVGTTFAAMGRAEVTTPPTYKSILQNYGFIDEDGDGINDLARDADNDGIPNCIDPDWVRPQDGTGYMNRYGHKNQNANQHKGGLYAYSHNNQWINNWANGNPNFCNQDGASGTPGRHRRSNRGN